MWKQMKRMLSYIELNNEEIRHDYLYDFICANILQYIYVYNVCVLTILDFLVSTHYHLFFSLCYCVFSGKGISNDHFCMKTRVLLHAFSYLPILWSFTLFLSPSDWYLVFHAGNIDFRQFFITFSIEFCFWETLIRF